MAAHLRAVRQPKCRDCGRPATAELYNTWNDRVGEYCAAHGKRALAEFIARNPEQGPA